MIDNRLVHFIRKEFWQLLHDRRMLGVAILAPVIQLIILGYVASTDVKNVSTAVLDQDNSYYSRNYLSSFQNSGYFNLKYQVQHDREIADLLDGGEARLALKIPVDFGRRIVRGDPVDVQAILDGVNSSSAMIIAGYVEQINYQHALGLLGPRGQKAGLIELRPRIWYNPEMKSVYFMVPAIFSLVLMIISMLLTSFSIVKEKERGTLEQLLVTPLKPAELILGKLLPFTIIALIDIVLVYLVARWWFRVPMQGSTLLLFSLGLIFLMTGLGLGVFISTISANQRQAMMAALFVMIPSIILSGFIFPIANMPGAIQLVTYFIPARYFLEIVRGLFLKGVGLNYLWGDVLALLVFGLVLLGASVWEFRRRLD
jgi:ABC-2 type transport system permease protein